MCVYMRRLFHHCLPMASRPFSGTWTMSCERPGSATGTHSSFSASLSGRPRAL